MYSFPSIIPPSASPPQTVLLLLNNAETSRIPQTLHGKDVEFSRFSSSCSKSHYLPCPDFQQREPYLNMKSVPRQIDLTMAASLCRTRASPTRFPSRTTRQKCGMISYLQSCVNLSTTEEAHAVTTTMLDGHCQPSPALSPAAIFARASFVKLNIPRNVSTLYLPFVYPRNGGQAGRHSCTLPK